MRGRLNRKRAALIGVAAMAFMMMIAAAGWMMAATAAAAPAQSKAPAARPAPRAKVPAPAAKAPANAALAQVDVSQGCMTAECHGDMKGRPFMHGPLNLGQCMPCHEPVANKHVFKPRSQDPVSSCLMCHEAEAKKAVVHPPFAGDCTLCHDPHGSDNRYFVKGGTGAGGCAQCHSDVTAGMDFVHGPVALGECLACHTPHQSDHKGLLVEAPAQLCQSCHVDVEENLKGAVSVHAPVKTDCSACHNAHGGKTKFFMAAEGKALCAQCHGDFLKEIDQFKHPHKVMDEGKACSACHLSHSSLQEKLLVSNNQELCLECHNKPVKAGERTLVNVADQIAHAKFLHGPLREQNCIACHQAHGSDHQNILEKSFPAEFYTAYKEGAYDLCFNCHDRTLVLQEKTTVTGFRNGEENLHFLHVNREKGRSCRACHQEHAANQPNHVRSEVPFGRWMMQVEFNKTETGGNCSTGCHLPYKYDRVNPVKNKS